MPFLSKAQRRKFYALKSQGKMDQATIDEWEKDTPKRLPERVMSKNAFLSGFLKRAAETYVMPQNAEQTQEKLLQWNDLGGVDPRSLEDMQVASAVALVTLPADVEGANCSTCLHFRMLDPDLGSGFCTNPQVKQDTTARMLCTLWEHPGCAKPWEGAEQAALEEQLALQQSQGSSPSQQIITDFQPQPSEGAAPGNGGQAQPPAGQPMQKEAGNVHMALKRLGKMRRGTSVMDFLSKRSR